MPTEVEHKETHNSIVAPTNGCEWCTREIRRRERRCFGDGESTTPQPKPPTTSESQ